jgi:23S rRNA (uracil1939-C5)-methyltransferase
VTKQFFNEKQNISFEHVTKSMGELHVGDILTTKINGYTHDGQGVARINRRVIFVPGALHDELVELEITAERKKIFYARLLSVLEPSEQRREPICSVYGGCGGCHLQHMSYVEEAAFKQGQVEAALQRIGNLERNSCEYRQILTAEQQYHYRNKGIFHVVRDGSGQRLEFWDESSHEPAGATCELLFPESVQQLTKWLGEQNLPENVTDVMIRYAFASDELMLCFDLNNSDKAEAAALLQQAVAKFANLKVWGVKIDGEYHVLSEQQFICDQLGTVKYQISPAAFFQVNNRQTLLMLETIQGCFEPEDKILLDAYCGIGTLGINLAKNLSNLQALIGVEINAAAVQNARQNAKLNQIAKAEFWQGRAEQEFAKIVARHKKIDVVIIDPPRRGCHQNLLEGLLQLAPQKIIYVSCNPATLARDLKILCAEKYKCRFVQPLDMFPRTRHVETVVLLSKLCPPERKIPVTIELSAFDTTSAEKKATYPQIKQWVLEYYGFKVSSLYIAQVKEKHGIKEAENYNIGKEGHYVPKCPSEKENAITAALKYFEMI